MESSVAIDWRTIQFFVGEEGVSEVQMDSERNSKVRCSCAAFASANRCKHTRFVKDKMKNNGGYYQVTVPEELSDEYVLDQMRDQETMRDFILHYHTVEYL